MRRRQRGHRARSPSATARGSCRSCPGCSTSSRDLRARKTPRAQLAPHRESRGSRRARRRRSFRNRARRRWRAGQINPRATAESVSARRAPTPCAYAAERWQMPRSADEAARPARPANLAPRERNRTTGRRASALLPAVESIGESVSRPVHSSRGRPLPPRARPRSAEGAQRCRDGACRPSTETARRRGSTGAWRCPVRPTRPAHAADHRCTRRDCRGPFRGRPPFGASWRRHG